MIQLISAEFLKLKYPPIYWLIFFVIAMMTGIIFMAHYFDINGVATLNTNPWNKLSSASIAILSIFLAAPFLVLLISAAVFVEHHSNIWKQQYATPSHRSTVFYSKLISIVLLILFTFLMIIVSITLSGYLLDFIYPEIEFRYHNPPFGKWIIRTIQMMISLLGIIGIQYFLSLRFKGFLIPASIGVVFFVVGIIFGSINNQMAAYFPYSFPVIGREHEMFNRDNIDIIDYGFINSIEIHSIVCFLIFIVMANVLEVRRKVD